MRTIDRLRKRFPDLKWRYAQHTFDWHSDKGHRLYRAVAMKSTPMGMLDEYELRWYMRWPDGSVARYNINRTKEFLFISESYPAET